MSTSSTIANHLACPDWCTDTHKVTDLTVMRLGGTERLVREHSGPQFGPFMAGAETDVVTGELFASVGFDDVVADLDGSGNPERFRKIAADSLAAAEWLEANQ
jgi:hypothetical protein